MKNIIGSIISAILSATLYVLYYFNQRVYFLIPAITITVLAVLFVVRLFIQKNKQTIKSLEERLEVWNSLSYHVNQAGDEAIDNLPIGILVYEDNVVKWTNNYLKTIFKSRLIDEALEDIIPEIGDHLENDKMFIIAHDGEYYEVLNYKEEETLYLFNVTKREQLNIAYNNRTHALGIILLDNLEESLRDSEMQEKSRIRGELLGTISAYAKEYKAFLQSYDDDRLVMVLEKEALLKMVENKFDVLNQIRDTASKNHVRVSVSIGVACYDNTADELGPLAQAAVELAEKRGGDQAVVNIQGEKIQYFGGKTNALEKNSLVMARVQASNLKELVEESTNVYITGHIAADADCLGSMICTLRMALSSNKEAYIVFEIEKADQSIRKLYESLKESAPDIYDRIIPLSDVDEKANSLLIVCDTQSPNIMMFKELLGRIQKLAVIDHHRQGEITFVNTNMSYVEPYASSTVELVSEMVSFYNRGIKFTDSEADVMLAGIVIDTNNFTFRTTSRTFEAASIVKEFGADMIRVRTLVRSSFETEQSIAQAVMKSTIFMNKYAISVLDDNYVVSDRSFLAQIADKLLDIDGIEAAFSIGKLSNDVIGISARSYEKINVQIIMEELGGGGHLSNAATQITDKTLPEVVTSLQDVIKIHDEGEEHMKVILVDDVKGQGKKGQIVEVANGYGNHLISQKLAIMATNENIKKVEAEQAEQALEAEKHHQMLLKLKDEIESHSINVFLSIGQNGKKTNSITSKNVCEEYEAQTGITLDKRKVTLPADINSVGIYTATVALSSDVHAQFEVKVVER